MEGAAFRFTNPNLSAGEIRRGSQPPLPILALTNKFPRFPKGRSAHVGVVGAGADAQENAIRGGDGAAGGAGFRFGQVNIAYVAVAYNN